ncbi:Protein CBG25303 [Caenorhabditis briggsae]|nr:Protein CBG25303 [Caenorhabditis briggsae]CAR99703.1 Protein CBG25303 [Caenorhabditis briggsae]
MIWLIR